MADTDTAAVMWWVVPPGAWARHAERLRRSAELLWQPVHQALTSAGAGSDPSRLASWDHAYAFLLVAGASLEAIFKSAALQARMNAGGLSTVITPDRKLQRWVVTHNLGKLAEVAKISLSTAELHRLERFSRSVVWAGSYPVPGNQGSRRNAALEIDFDLSDGDYVWFGRMYARAEESYRKHVERWPATVRRPRASKDSRTLTAGVEREPDRT